MARPTEPLITLSWAQASVFASVLLGLASASYLVLVEKINQDPRRLVLDSTWTQIPTGASVVTAIVALGPPNVSVDRYERVPACATDGVDSSPVACSAFYICVREHTWYAAGMAESGNAYTLCADTEGTIRSKSEGMAFFLTTW